MGREVRRVPADWQHPQNDEGDYIPMHPHFPYNEEEIAEGLAEGWLKGVPPNYGLDIMPQWEDSERTHWQMYEDTTEGTPISPVMESPEELARWLADNGASAFASMTATYDQWLATIYRGRATDAVYLAGVYMSGVEFTSLLFEGELEARRAEADEVERRR